MEGKEFFSFFRFIFKFEYNSGDTTLNSNIALMMV